MFFPPILGVTQTESATGSSLPQVSRATHALSQAPAFLALVLAVASLVLLVFAIRRKRLSSKDVPFWYAVLQTLFMALFRVRYRLRVVGLENLPKDGPVIVVCNHISFIESILLSAIAHRRLRFLTWSGYRNIFMRMVVRLLGLIPVSPDSSKKAIRTACEHLAAGDCIALFPEGQISRNGTMGAFQGGAAFIARKSGASVVPAAVDGLWGSLFSFFDGPGFLKFPRAGRPSLSVAFGAPVPPAEVATLRDRVQLLLTTLYGERPEFQRNLAREIVHSLARHPGFPFVVDRGGPKRVVLGGALLYALARHVARVLRPRIGAEPRVAILLPPGAGATVANIAVLLLGRSPVNLNFTLGPRQFVACIETTGVKTFITAQALREKLDEKIPDFPWSSMERIVDVAKLLDPAELPKFSVALDLVSAWALPGAFLSALNRLPRRGGEREATVLCTSGSSGQPKGVPLTHHNILVNCGQFDATRLIRPGAILFGNLPIFHSFGITVTLWFPLTRAVRVVNTPSPLETQKNINTIREECPTILLGTPTFYRGYLKKADPKDLKSVELVIAGAEKTPDGFAEEWETRLGGRYVEGYGATETTPVAALNLSDIRDPNVRDGLFVGKRQGSVGRLVVGMSARFTNPIDGKPAPAGVESGVMWLKGGNVFGGYLGQPALTKEVLSHDGWYCTGDIARRDEEGFIFIEGRQARFSKIGGEMVPHGAVEEAIRRAFHMKFGDDALQRIAVTSRFDENKGEALVLLTTIEIEAESLRAALAAESIANLWIPRIIKRVDAIPVLSTGKLDLQKMRELAEAD
ncbi:MAG: AMP-binding protein [Puniceicoccales bacterium]|jgi:acyl-[acyl-carrier-protein]-phospholipid O-acyltransferase/long-chain-fatty-acid--[acyl-carrier-protein] ligase|nr:AMP-binding protein [Puniceicoccales bacterium]